MYSCIKINRKKIRAELLKVFKIKGYDFIQVQVIPDEEDEAFG